MIPSYTLTGNGRHNLQTFIIVILCSNLNLMLGNHKITFRVAMHSHVSFCSEVKEKVASCF